MSNLRTVVHMSCMGQKIPIKFIYFQLYLKSIPAAVVNGRTPRASVRFSSSGLSLDLSVCCSCCPGERTNKWAISGRCLAFNLQD
ncbi:hypothetical protein Peur_001605 [Populus x canadensis]